MAERFFRLLDASAKVRFWDKVERGEPDNCWCWTAARSAKGYGVFSVLSRTVMAHRVSLAMKIGRDLRDEELACHRCDNPSCVNPAHLYVASAAMNSQDMVRRGRSRFGERCPTSKLTRHEVAAIRAMAGTMTQQAIGELFGVRDSTVSRIISGKRRAKG